MFHAKEESKTSLGFEVLYLTMIDTMMYLANYT